MTRPRDPVEALAKIPGWEAATWCANDGGRTNESWLVERDGERALLKIDPAPRTPPLNDRLQEAELQRAAAGQGLANRVLYASDTVLLTEYVAGHVWDRTQTPSDSELIELARAIRKVHTLPPTGRRFDPLGAAEQYLEQIDGALRDEASVHVETIRNMAPPTDSTCSHNDLVAENILVADGIRFLDWEYCADNDPLFDIATIVVDQSLSRQQANLMLDAYSGSNGGSHIERLAELEKLYSSLCWLWEASRPGR